MGIARVYEKGGGGSWVSEAPVLCTEVVLGGLPLSTYIILHAIWTPSLPPFLHVILIRQGNVEET